MYESFLTGVRRIVEKTSLNNFFENLVRLEGLSYQIGNNTRIYNLRTSDKYHRFFTRVKEVVVRISIKINCEDLIMLA